jgi:DNA polymerase III subunit epsilon
MVYKDMASIKKVFYDLETTGLLYFKHGIHQIAGIVEIDDEIVERFNYRVRPHRLAEIDQGALNVGKVTKEEILSYPDMDEVHKDLINLLSKYIDRYNPNDKAYLAGFNNSSFDDDFLTIWFEQNDDKFFASWFYPGRLDVMTLASQYLINRRPNMQSFKLKSVAKELGLIVDDSRLHDGVYDVELTRDIYRIVTGLEIEI